MSAGDVQTTFTVDGSEKLVQSLARIEASAAQYTKEWNKGFKEVESAFKTSTKEIEQTADDFWDDLTPKGLGTQWQNELNGVGSSMEKAAVEAKKLKDQMEDTQITGIVGSTKFGKKINALIPKISEVSNKFKMMGNVAQAAIAGTAVAAFAALTFAVGTVTKTIGYAYRKMKEAHGAAIEFEQSMAIMESTFKNLEKTADDISFESAVDQMEELYKNTLFAKSEIISMQAAIARTSINEDVFKKAAQATLDVAAAKPNMSIDAASQWITTLLGDPSRTMDKFRRAEIQVSESFQKSMELMIADGRLVEAQLATLDQLISRFGGAAEDAAQTTTGQLQMVAKSWEGMWRERSQMFMDELLPGVQAIFTLVKDNEDSLTTVFRTAADVVGDISEELERWEPTLDKLAQGLGSAGGLGGGKRSDAARDSTVGDVITIFSAALRSQVQLLPIFSTVPIKKANEDMKEMEQLTEQMKQNLRDFGLTEKPVEDPEAAKVRQAQRNVKATEAWQKAITEMQHKALVAEQNVKEAEAEFQRAWKRIGVMVDDQAEPMERYAEQLRKIADARAKAIATGNMTVEMNNKLAETQKRLYETAKEAQAKFEEQRMLEEHSEFLEAAAAGEKSLKDDKDLIAKNDPLKNIRSMMTDFDRLSVLARSGNKRALAAAEEVQERMQAMANNKATPPAFSSISTDIEGLYSVLRDQANASDPVVDELTKMQQLRENIAARESKKMDDVITAIKAPKPGIAGP